MSENCSHDCSSCGQSCPSKNSQSLVKQPHKLSDIRKVIAVVSGKGGVGKSMTSALLACASQNSGYVSALMDADITGPSIPRMFGIKERAMGSEAGILPVVSKGGVQIMSMNVLLEKEDDPVVWRGSLISGTVLQFWTDVIWQDVDYMFVDMPPGTGDVPLTVFQSLPIDGIIIVTTPQDLVGMIVAKAVNMAHMMNIPILGIVENMSYITCPDCGRKISIFGESGVDALALEHGIKAVAKVPVDHELTKAADGGNIEDVKNNYLTEFFVKIDAQLKENSKKKRK
jgi:Mrp family chromosome partitioning ATPase